MKKITIFKVATSLFLLSSCASLDNKVEIWERGNLAQKVMAPDYDPLKNLLIKHVYFTREASAGGESVGGGGCGCN